MLPFKKIFGARKHNPAQLPSYEMANSGQRCSANDYVNERIAPNEPGGVVQTCPACAYREPFFRFDCIAIPESRAEQRWMACFFVLLVIVSATIAGIVIQHGIDQKKLGNQANNT